MSTRSRRESVFRACLLNCGHGKNGQLLYFQSAFEIRIEFAAFHFLFVIFRSSGAWSPHRIQLTFELESVFVLDYPQSLALHHEPPFHTGVRRRRPRCHCSLACAQVVQAPPQSHDAALPFCLTKLLCKTLLLSSLEEVLIIYRVPLES